MDKEDFERKLVLLDRWQSACTHCGLCSEACSTYQATGWEQESPRGRIRLARDFIDGKIQPNSTTLETFDRCLGCHACENICPLSVQYQNIRLTVQDLRRSLQIKTMPAYTKILYRRWIKLAYRLGNRWWKLYGLKILAFFNPLLKTAKKRFKKRSNYPKGLKDIFLATCCIQELFNHDLLQQTILFLRRLGYEAHFDRKQPCCGAIFERLIEGGEETIRWEKERQQAIRYQKQRIQAFKKWWTPSTYFLSKGCQCFIDPYLEKQPSQHDFYTWIKLELLSQDLKLVLEKPKVVYYQPYCSQTDKGKQDVIWQLLSQIEGLTIRWLSAPLSCCGGYKGETLLNPQQASQLIENKIQALPQKATLIISSPDCWAHFRNILDDKAYDVIYPIQLLYQTQCARVK